MQDKLNVLSDDQDLAQVAGSYLSTYSYDTGPAGTPPHASVFGGARRSPMTRRPVARSRSISRSRRPSRRVAPPPCSSSAWRPTTQR